MAKIRSVVNTIEKKGFVACRVVLYLFYFVYVLRPFAGRLLSVGVVASAFLVYLDPVIHIQFGVLSRVLLSSCQIDPDIHMVLVVVRLFWCHLGG